MHRFWEFFFHDLKNGQRLIYFKTVKYKEQINDEGINNELLERFSEIVY